MWIGRFMKAIMVVFLLVIGLSRLYLGVHFPTDLLGGWFLAAVILTAYYLLSPLAVRLLLKGGQRMQLISVCVLALIMNAVLPNDKSLTALFLGFCCGYSLIINHAPFHAGALMEGKKPSLAVLLLRFIVGGSVASIVYLLFEYFMPGTNPIFTHLHLRQGMYRIPFAYAELAGFIRFVLIGLWISAGAVIVFMRLGLAEWTLSEAGAK
jgi:hypothetical protein